MRPSARATWLSFITKDEGNIPYMYLDTKGLVTVGIGNLIDPVSLALGLPFVFRAKNRHRMSPGRQATKSDIQTEWNYIKSHPQRKIFEMRGHTKVEPYASLELSTADRLALFRRTTLSYENTLRNYFKDYGDWPADAQLGLLAMAWGLGPYFPKTWPRFKAACQKQDFDGAVKACRVSSWRPSRNRKSVHLFGNAARVHNNPSSYDPKNLYYPSVLLDTVVVTASTK